jgi:hypothetical protein
LNCRFTSAELVAPTVTAEADAWEADEEVELGPMELNGACWVTFTFVMLSVKGDAVPVYVQRTLV